MELLLFWSVSGLSFNCFLQPLVGPWYVNIIKEGPFSFVGEVPSCTELSCTIHTCPLLQWHRQESVEKTYSKKKVAALESTQELFTLLSSGKEPPCDVEIVDPPERDIQVIDLLDDDDP